MTKAVEFSRAAVEGLLSPSSTEVVRNSKRPVPPMDLHKELPDPLLRLQAAGDEHARRMQDTQAACDGHHELGEP